MLKHQNSRDCIYCIWFTFSFQITQTQGFGPTMLHEMDVVYSEATRFWHAQLFFVWGQHRIQVVRFWVVDNLVYRV